MTTGPYRAEQDGSFLWAAAGPGVCYDQLDRHDADDIARVLNTAYAAGRASRDEEVERLVDAIKYGIAMLDPNSARCTIVGTRERLIAALSK